MVVFPHAAGRGLYSNLNGGNGLFHVGLFIIARCEVSAANVQLIDLDVNAVV